MTEKLEVEGVIETLHARYKKIEIILSQVSDEDYAKLLSSARVRLIVEDD